jgi:hypothetical protein
MSSTESEPARPPVEIVSVTPLSESDHGAKVQIEARLANVPEGSDRDRFHVLSMRVFEAVGSHAWAGVERLQVQVRRDGLEQAVREIRQAITDFNDAYPSLLAQHRRKVEQQEAEKTARAERLQEDQRVIDRVLGERGRGPEDVQRGETPDD